MISIKRLCLVVGMILGSGITYYVVNSRNVRCIEDTFDKLLEENMM